MAKNIRELLLDATKYPAALEAALPAGAPKISTMMADAATQIPAMPDLPVEIPDLPEAPALPAVPALPTVPAPLAAPGLGRYVTGVTVTPGGTVRREVIPSPTVGVLPEVRTRRGM